MQDYFSYFDGIKTIQTFSDSKTNNSLAQIFHFDIFDYEVAEVLVKMNIKGAGIYMTINETDGKGRRKHNVTRIRAVFADLDTVPLSVVNGYAPSIIVETSPNRFHCYWLAKDVPLEAFTPMQKNLIRIFGSDPIVHDLPRVLRVPGYYHQKRDPFLSNICGGSEEIYSYKRLVQMFPPQQVKQWSAKKYHLDTSHKGIVAGGFKGVYGASNGLRNSHVLSRIGGMLKRGCAWDYIEAEALKEGHACSPPLEDLEIRAILKSARRYDATA
jgi:hypothetical protein